MVKGLARHSLQMFRRAGKSSRSCLTFPHVRTIMGGLHISSLSLASVVGIDVDCSQELAYAVEGLEFLE